MMRFLKNLAGWLVYPLSFLVPRKRHRWVFGSFRNAFADNAKYLFIYCSQHFADVECVWISQSATTVAAVKGMGLKAYRADSLRGAWKAMSAKVWFVNSYTSDVLFGYSGGACVVNLWHGVGLKRTEFNITSGALARRYVDRRLSEVFYHPDAFRRPDWLVSSTAFQSTMFAKAFRIAEERCLELGYPRNYILTCTEAERRAHIERYEGEATRSLIHRVQGGGYSRVYIYMPTWRDSQRGLFEQHLDLQRLEQLMAERNALFLLKPHANVLRGAKAQPVGEHIVYVDGNVDVYPLLPYTDVLVTDYSSVLYDYLLMPGKEAILYLYDYDDYVRERDFYYPFDSNVAGSRAYTFEQLCQCIGSGCAEGFAAERDAVVERFWGNTAAGDARSRVATHFHNLICR